MTELGDNTEVDDGDRLGARSYHRWAGTTNRLNANRVDSTYSNRNRGRAGTGGSATGGSAACGGSTNSSRRIFTHRDVSEEPCLLVATLLIAVTGTIDIARAHRDRVCWSVVGTPAIRRLYNRECVICLASSLAQAIGHVMVSNCVIATI